MTRSITVKEAADMLRNGQAFLIDVREPDEFKQGHIAYAMSIPLSSFEDGFSKLDIPKDKTLLFQCLKGSRGEMACQRVQGLEGCENDSANIEGGITAWKEAGLPVIQSGQDESKISIFRQVQIIVGFLVALFVFLGALVMPNLSIVAGVLGLALFFAGLTGWCGLALLLSKMPWNK